MLYYAVAIVAVLAATRARSMLWRALPMLALFLVRPCHLSAFVPPRAFTALKGDLHLDCARNPKVVGIELSAQVQYLRLDCACPPYTDG